MSETHVSHTKPWSRMRRLSESRGGSKMTKPISSNSGKHYWDAAQDKAFEEVKRLLKQAPVLAYFYLTLRRNCLFIVTTVRKVWEPMQAEKRLQQLKRCFQRCPEFAAHYKTVMNDYIDKGYSVKL